MFTRFSNSQTPRPHRPLGSLATALAMLSAAALLVVSSLGASLALAGPLAQSQSDLDQLKVLSGKDFEIAFLSEMIQHHQSALDMANLVTDRAAHQELKDAAQKIIADQTKEIGEMTGWLKLWYGVAPTPGMMHDMPGMSMADMMNLQNLKGDDFDKQFLNMMRMHHQGAVTMAQLVPSRATHQEVKTLAQNIASSQSAEIKQFEGWLMTWYNASPSGNMPGMSGSMMGTGNMGAGGMAGGANSAPGASMPPTGQGETIGLLVLAVAVLASIAALAGGVLLRKRA